MCEYTIITVCINAEKEIGKTINSVISQNIDIGLIELVIVDGLSSDYTKQVVESYYKRADEVGLTIRFYSEKDSGIYDAMNKGARLAGGKWCLYLNAGDSFFDKNSFAFLVDCKKDSYDIVYGDSVHSYKGRYVIVKSRNEQSLTYQNGTEFCHQSCIITKDYLITNPYSMEYKIAGDCDFFTRAFINGERFHYIPKVISIFDKEGVSSTNGGNVTKENADVKYKYGLISEKDYRGVTKQALRHIKVRAILPKFIINLRHRLIMQKATSNWKTYDEICAEINVGR